MNAALKLAVFAAVLVALFFAGLAVGSAVGTNAPPPNEVHVHE